jgi:hypothetical protein
MTNDLLGTLSQRCIQLKAIADNKANAYQEAFAEYEASNVSMQSGGNSEAFERAAIVHATAWDEWEQAVDEFTLVWLKLKQEVKRRRGK